MTYDDMKYTNNTTLIVSIFFLVGFALIMLWLMPMYGVGSLLTLVAGLIVASVSGVSIVYIDYKIGKN